MRQLLFTVLLSFFGFLQGQGLIYVKDSSDQREVITLTRSTLASSVDYTKYTPTNYQQVGGTCVAHSFAKARAILLNKRLNETDNVKKLAHHFSPYFIYFNLTSPNDTGCSRGLNIETAARFVLNYGLAPMVMVEYPSYYPFTQYCLGFPYPNRYPQYYSEDAQVAASYKFTSIYRLNTAYDVKYALNEGMAVVVGMTLTEEFAQTKVSTYSYGLYHRPISQGHAMVVVGYSDYIMGGAFKIANSWGTQWGDNGFVWIDYNSFMKMLVVAYGCSDVSTMTYGAPPADTTATAPLAKFSDSILQSPSFDTSSAKGVELIPSDDIKALKKKIKAPKKYMMDLSAKKEGE